MGSLFSIQSFVAKVANKRIYFSYGKFDPSNWMKIDLRREKAMRGWSQSNASDLLDLVFCFVFFLI